MKSDCHVHIALNGVSYESAATAHSDGVNKDLVKQALARYRELGFTFLRDGGDRWGASQYAASIAGDYGIDYRTTAFPVYKAGTYGSLFGRSFDTFAELKNLLKEIKDSGSSYVKIMLSGIMSFKEYGVITGEPLGADLIKAIIDTCHDAGLSVMAHINGDESVSAAIDAGAETIEHGYYMSTETLDKLAQSNTVWVPTLSPIANLLPYKLLSSTYEFTPLPKASDKITCQILRKIYTHQCKSLDYAVNKGALIAAGSDAGAVNVLHAEGGLQEKAYIKSVLGAKTSDVVNTGAEKIKELF